MVRLEISTHIFLSDGLGTQQYHFWVHGIVENKVVSFLLIFVILMIFSVLQLGKSSNMARIWQK